LEKKNEQSSTNKFMFGRITLNKYSFICIQIEITFSDFPFSCWNIDSRFSIYIDTARISWCCM